MLKSFLGSSFVYVGEDVTYFLMFFPIFYFLLTPKNVSIFSKKMTFSVLRPLLFRWWTKPKDI